MSADQSTMDLEVQFAFSRVVNGFLQLLGILVLMAQIKWQILLLVFPIAGACLLYQVLTILNCLMCGTPDWQDPTWPNRVTKMLCWDHKSMNYESNSYDHWKMVLSIIGFLGVFGARSSCSFHPQSPYAFQILITQRLERERQTL